MIVGGVLVGRDLIKAAEVRATITQIEKYQSAAATFQGKFGALPGDIGPAAVTQFGFTAGASRSGAAGNGDGNGELDGLSLDGWNQSGETLYFWEDLSTNSNLIEGTFNAYSGPANPTLCTSLANCSLYFPSAKIGNGAYIYVYSGYAANCIPYCPTGTGGLGPNFFGLSILSQNRNVSLYATVPAGPALTVAQAAAIDKKIDDGLPTQGNVLAQYLGASNSGPNAGQPGWSASGSTPSATTCYDTSSGTAAYSVSYQNGNNVTCGLSFKFQAGD